MRLSLNNVDELNTICHMGKHLLLGSGGLGTRERFEAWIQAVDQFLGTKRRILFIPYAGNDHQAYLTRVKDRDLHSGRHVEGIHTFSSTTRAIEDAEVISVGGGNTFRLLNEIQCQGLMPLIREKVLAGTPYIGISAGTNLACPTIKTTNDMPVVCPANLNALYLIPFQINPHFFPSSIYYKNAEGGFDVYAGETREDRIREYHEVNQLPVLGLWEGSILKVQDNHYELQGAGNARLFRKNQPAKDFKPGETLDVWL